MYCKCIKVVERQSVYLQEMCEIATIPTVNNVISSPSYFYFTSDADEEAPISPFPFEFSEISILDLTVNDLMLNSPAILELVSFCFFPKFFRIITLYSPTQFHLILGSRSQPC